MPSDLVIVDYKIETSDAEITSLNASLNFVVYPNPLTVNSNARNESQLTISFNLSDKDVLTQLSIFNIKGQKIESFDNYDFKRGANRVVWASTDNKSILSNGIYFVKLQLNEKVYIKKVMLLR